MTNRHAGLVTSTCYPIDDMLEPLVDVASERNPPLVSFAFRKIPCDSLAVLRLHEGMLVPVIMVGLRAEALARRFAPADHPRLAYALAARGPVRFTDPSMPDPFDGLFAHRGDVHSRVHACIGSPVTVDGEVIGVLTMDALDPAAFDAVEDETVEMLAALAGAELHAAALADALALVAARERLVARQLVREALERDGGELLGPSPGMIRVRHEVDLLAGSELTGLVTGETGVGKELVVRAVHAQSRRSKRPLVHVNCAALPETLAESELFGHVRGAFTGALDHRAGKFEIADGGTLFLDEIGELPLSIQPKLLRVLQSGEVQRVGADRTLRVDVRVIAATNRDLAEEVRAGRFRSDLYYRLSVYPLRVPPLRERMDDIPVLTGHFLDAARARLGLGPVRITEGARQLLRSHAWPGNVRELEHTLMRAALCASQGKKSETIVIDVPDLGLGVSAPSTLPTPPAPAVSPEPPVQAIPRPPLREAVNAFTIQLITTTIAECDDNWAEAARRLGLQRGNLHRLAARLGVHHG